MTDELLLRTRPSVVEAKRITPENRDTVITWINNDVAAWSYGTTGVTWHQEDAIHDAFVGDWVVKNAWGEFHRVPDSILFSRFESVVAAVSE